MVAWPEVCERAAGLSRCGAARAAARRRARAAARARRRAARRVRRSAVRAARRATAAPTRSRARRRAARARRAVGMPLVAATEVLYHSRARRPLQDVLTCIRHGVTLATAGRRIRGNDEHDLARRTRSRRLFADDPARGRAHAARSPRAARSRSASCATAIRRSACPTARPPPQHLRALDATTARARRYGGERPGRRRARQLDDRARADRGARLRRLLPHDVRDRRVLPASSGILCQGRGSAANSAVCYCLGITAVDPVRMGLLFERFLSRERAEPPDIDLDIEHERREEVIQHVYEKYGRDHAAMVANVIRYRAALGGARRRQGARPPRDRARPRREACSRMYGDVEPTALARAGLDTASAPRTSTSLRLRRRDPRVPAPPLDPPRRVPARARAGARPRPDRERDDAGPHRDPVGQGRPRGRSACSRSTCSGSARCTSSTCAFDLLRAHRGIDLSMATIPAEDAADLRHDLHAPTPSASSRSRAARRCRCCRGCAADVLRPRHRGQHRPPRARSPAAWCIPYLRRRNGQEPVDYPAPVPEPGAREDARRAAVPGAGDAARDGRRRLHAGRGRPAAPRHGRVAPIRPDRAAPRAAGRRAWRPRASRREFAERVFEQIRGFGEYGFPESHAASFALIAYATAWLRRPLPGRVHLRAAQRAADGLLLAGDDRRRRPAPRPRDPADRRHARATGTARWSRRPTRFEFAVRMGLRWIKGLAARRRPAHRGGAARPARSPRSRTSCAARSCRRACTARSRRPARSASCVREPARCAVAGHRLDRAARRRAADSAATSSARSRSTR